MVLNFFQLQNHTAMTFDLINSENPRDNYTVGPYITSARGDMWLAQGDGSKGVSIRTYSPGSAIFNLLFMWDQNWSLCYRVAGGQLNRIHVNGSKDFWIEVYPTRLDFVCHNGTFDGSNTRVTVPDWQDQLTNAFLEEVSDLEILHYARKFSVSQDEELRGADTQDSVLGKLQIRGAHIQEPTASQKREIENLVAEWVDDFLEHGRRQGTLYGSANGWRIDLQDNGAVERNGVHFYNIAVQYRSGGNNVYAHILLPVGYQIGRRRIRNALLRSMMSGEVTTIFPPENARLPVYTSDEARRSWAVRSLAWMALVGTASVLR